MPATGLVYFVLMVFAVKTMVRNTEWWDTEYLAKAGMKTNPLNAKMFMTMGNVLAQKVSCSVTTLGTISIMLCATVNVFTSNTNWCQLSQSLKSSSFITQQCRPPAELFMWLCVVKK